LRHGRLRGRGRHGADGVRVVRRRAGGGDAVTVMLAATAAALFGIGTYLLLQRKLSRIIIGLGLLTHGANVLLITAGRRGSPPIIGRRVDAAFADPLPQPLALTAIVITFGVTTLLLAPAYRSWLLTQ